MKKLLFVAMGTVLASMSFAQTFAAAHDSVIETTGTYSADSTYFNVGLSGGKYNSLGVLDFDASSIGGLTVDSATLTLTHSDYSSSKATTFTVWAVSNNTASIGSTNTSIVYGTGAGYTDGLGTQLGTATDLGTFNFVPNTTNVNTQNVVTLGNLSALTSLAGTSTSDIRLVLTSDQLGLGTFFGTKGATAPSLTVTTAAVPEPASMSALALGGLVLLRRRKKS